MGKLFLDHTTIRGFSVYYITNATKLFLDHTTLQMLRNPHHHNQVKFPGARNSRLNAAKLFLDHTTSRMLRNLHHHKEVLAYPKPGKISWAKEQSSKEQW